MFFINTLTCLKDALHQKEQALIQYVRYIRESQDSQDQETAALFADLAKAEEKHITVIRDQVAKYSENSNELNRYEQINQDISQNLH